MRSFCAVIVSLLLTLYYTSCATGSVIPKGNAEAFNVHITEKGTKFVEKITIDEDNDVEYFHVPAHNELTEADYLYDFKNNMSVQRVKSDANCYLGPLPENLPKPVDLKTGLQMVSQAPSSKNKVIVRKYWAVTEQVDKTILRQEVQDFCGQFPIFRLKEVILNSKDGLDNRGVGRTRLARQINLNQIPFCDKDTITSVGSCHPHDWLYSFEIRDQHCTWWVRKCKFNIQSRTVCEEWEHKFNSMICYQVSCP